MFTTAVAVTMLLSYTMSGYTHVQVGGSFWGYNYVKQTDSSTICRNSGFASCPKRQSWQTKLDDFATADGLSIGSISVEEIDEIVYDNMRNVGVPDRQLEETLTQFPQKEGDSEKFRMMEVMMEDADFQKLIELMKSEQLSAIRDDWRLMQKVEELEKVYRDIQEESILDAEIPIEDIPIKWEYSGAVAPSYYHAPTKEFVIRIITWEAITLKDFRWTHNVVIVPEEEYIEYILNNKKK